MRTILHIYGLVSITGSIPLLVDLVPVGSIHQVISVSVRTWFIRYVYDLQFLNNVTVIKIYPHSGIGDISRLWLSCVSPLVFFTSIDF
jgi:hypothetical protein